MNFIVTVDSFNAQTGAPIDTAHWTVRARSLSEAQSITEGQVTNANRTIPTVRNELVKVEPFKLDTCSYLRRNVNCQGHRERPALAQQRGGNETR